MPTIAILGTYDSKGHELAFVAEVIRQRGHTALLIDVGTLDPPQVEPDIGREQILDFSTIGDRKDRGACVAAMSAAAPPFVAKLAAEGRFQGVISLGGGGGTAIGTAVMRALPVGFPKLMVTTLASGNTAPYVGTKDIVMFPSIVDVAGLNSLSRMLFTRAAGAISGMVEAQVTTSDDKPLIVASMFGNTTACVTEAKKILEEAGYEVLVFHATGTGGRTMESLIESGIVSGVLDITTTEWADELVGGILGAGPTRLDAAAKAGVPAVVTPGCLDMVNFGEPATVPDKFNGRTFYHHNPQVTLMRTTPQECAELGRILAEKLNAYTAPVTLLLPTKAISVISAEGKPFHSPEADTALFAAIKKHLRPDLDIVEMDCEINDPAFARACAHALLRNMALDREAIASRAELAAGGSIAARH
ncbi:MAG: Tm-1-like ATP-binding domain-containing protein [Verrucomicrobiales bacterium]